LLDRGIAVELGDGGSFRDRPDSPCPDAKTGEAFQPKDARAEKRAFYINSAASSSVRICLHREQRKNPVLQHKP
jgi:hypothetical protein